MNQRLYLMIAAGLTAFVLVLVGGVASRLSTIPAPEPTTAATELAAAPTVALDPTIEALIREREAAYQVALNEANARLEQANQQIAEAAAAAAAQPAASYDGSPEAAAAIAVVYRGGGDVREVERETERGMVVYEVTFRDGVEVYVDGATGEVVYAQMADGEYAEHDEDGEHAD